MVQSGVRRAELIGEVSGVPTRSPHFWPLDLRQARRRPQPTTSTGTVRASSMHLLWMTLPASDCMLAQDNPNRHYAVKKWLF